MTGNCYSASATIEYNNVYFCKYLTHKSQTVWEENGCMDHSLGPHTHINILLWEEVPINCRMQIKFVCLETTPYFFLFDVSNPYTEFLEFHFQGLENEMPKNKLA